MASDNKQHDDMTISCCHMNVVIGNGKAVFVRKYLHQFKGLSVYILFLLWVGLLQTEKMFIEAARGYLYAMFTW